MLCEQKCCDIISVKHQDQPKIKIEENLSSGVQASLDTIIAKEGYETYDTKINIVNTEGGNFLGSLYEVDIKGQTKEGPHETNIFIKHMPKDNLFTGVIAIDQCYCNEVFVYEEISKIMNDLYDEYIVPKDERFKMVKCYTESNENALIFENLSRKGYATLDRRQVISLNYAKTAINELAKFHAITFILKAKRSDFFEKRIKTIKSPIFFDKNEQRTNTEWWTDYFTKTINICFDHVNEEYKNKKEKINFLWDKLFEMVAVNSQSRLSSVNCMCHGDVKPGNILWRENKENEAETVFIDYQLLNYSTPVYDILFFIYTGTDRQFRRDHLDYLKNLYHNTMTEFLKYFDLDINSFYPRHIFEKDFKDKLHYGLLFGLLNLPFFLDEEPDTIVSTMSDRPIIFHSSFKDRINGVFQDYIEWGIL